MALITCIECGKEISDKAKICPNCGIDISNKFKKRNGLISIIVGIILVIFGMILFINSIKSLLIEKSDLNVINNNEMVSNRIGEITYSVSNKWILTKESGDYVYYPFDNVGIIISSQYYSDLISCNEDEKERVYEKIVNSLTNKDIEKKVEDKILNNIKWRTYNFVEEREFLIYCYINDNSGYITTIILGEINQISDKSKDVFNSLLNSIKFEELKLKNNLNNEVTSVTLGEKNALKKAKNYLAIMPYSYSGLVQQLEFEGFTKEEAEYGVTSVGY